MNPRRRRRNRFYYRKRRRNWWPWLVFIAVAALFFWAIFQFFLVLFSSVRSESISVELAVENGRAEFLLAENTNWNPAFSEQKFLEGDSIKTAKNSRVALRFLDNNQLFLDEETELKIVELTQRSSGETKAIFSLVSGQLWGQINENNFSLDKDSVLVIQTNRSHTSVTGTTFNLSTDNEQDVLSLIDGQVSVEVLNGDKKGQTVVVGVGQALVVNAGTADLIARSGNPISAVNPQFEESDWYIDNLERQDPERAAAIRERLKPPAPAIPEVPAEAVSDAGLSFFESLELDSEIAAPEVTTPVQGESIGAGVDLLPIKGTAPAEAYQIQVNDYVLQRFEPGDRIWTYIAATEYGTLKPGENTYNVVAITREGKRSTITTLTINYEGSVAAPPAETTAPPADTETEAETSTVPPVSNLPAPVVTRPALFAAAPEATYETSASVVTFAGTVDPATQAVEVNGFRLRKFEPGDTEFSYIANATYGNMREGENIYTIKAFGPGNQVSQTQIKIFYRPVNLD